MAHAFAPIHALPKSAQRRLSQESSSNTSQCSSTEQQQQQHQEKQVVHRTPSPAMEALPETVLSPEGRDDESCLSPMPAAAATSTPQRSRSSSGESYNSMVEEEEEELQVPLIGYEIMEQRSRFTVFRLQVIRNDSDNWILFRRYTDFVRLNDQLQVLFPNLRFALPPKKWFGSNFDRTFLEDRMLGLQAFLNNIVGNTTIKQSNVVRKFLCVDDPPGQHESLEESRALCETLEEQVYILQRDLSERDCRITQLEQQLQQLNTALDTLNLRPDRRFSTASAPTFSGKSSPARQKTTEAACGQGINERIVDGRDKDGIKETHGGEKSSAEGQGRNGRSLEVGRTEGQGRNGRSLDVGRTEDRDVNGSDSESANGRSVDRRDRGDQGIESKTSEGRGTNAPSTDDVEGAENLLKKENDSGNKQENVVGQQTATANATQKQQQHSQLRTGEQQDTNEREQKRWDGSKLVNESGKDNLQVACAEQQAGSMPDSSVQFFIGTPVSPADRLMTAAATPHKFHNDFRAAPT